MSNSGLWLSSDGVKTSSKTNKEDLLFESGETVKSFLVVGTTKAVRLILVMPVFSGAIVSGVISIENEDGVEIYSTPDATEDNTHIFSPDKGIPLVGINTVKLTLSSDPLSSGTCSVTLYLEEG